MLQNEREKISNLKLNVNSIKSKLENAKKRLEKESFELQKDYESKIVKLTMERDDQIREKESIIKEKILLESKVEGLEKLAMTKVNEAKGQA